MVRQLCLARQEKRLLNLLVNDTRLFEQELLQIFSELFSVVPFPSHGILMSCVRAIEQFDWLAPSDAAEKLKSIRISSTRAAERLDATIVRDKQCK